MKRKLASFLILLLFIFSLSACDIKFNFIKDTTDEIETKKNSFIKRMNEGLNVIIDNKTMSYQDGKAYIDSKYTNSSHTTKMNELLTQVESINEEFYELYSDYVAVVNKNITATNSDFYSYKSNQLNTYISDEVITKIASLVEMLDNDLDINKRIQIQGINSARLLQNYNYCESKNINITKNAITEYVNSFAEQYKTLPYMSKTCLNNIASFLLNYDIKVEDTDTIDYDGYTSFSNNKPVSLTLKYNDDTLGILGTLTHEIGHVSDTTFTKLDTDEAYACATEALSYYLSDSFNFNTTSYFHLSTYYKQRVLYDTINSFYSWVGYLTFIRQVYNDQDGLSLDEIKDFMDNTYSSVSFSYDEKYSILWKTMWIYYAYYDISESGSFVYTYGAINSAYLWDLYENNRPEAIEKYQALMSYKSSFKSFDSIGLIGEANLLSAFSSLKKLILEDLSLIKTLTIYNLIS